MIGVTNFARSGALVQSTVVGVNSRDVEVGDNFIGSGRKVTNLDPDTTINRLNLFVFLRAHLKCHLSDDEIFFPSSSHAISGNGFPEAEHLRETLGPG